MLTYRPIAATRNTRDWAFAQQACGENFADQSHQTRRRPPTAAWRPIAQGYISRKTTPNGWRSYIHAISKTSRKRTAARQSLVTSLDDPRSLTRENITNQCNKKKKHPPIFFFSHNFKEGWSQGKYSYWYVRMYEISGLYAQGGGAAQFASGFLASAEEVVVVVVVLHVYSMMIHLEGGKM